MSELFYDLAMASYSISVMRNDGSSALFEFQPGKVTIGQHQGEIATLDPSVADPHGALHFDGQTLTYVDAGSPSGSFLPSGERVAAPITLQPGGVVAFGQCKLMVQEIRHDPAMPVAPTPPAPAVASAPMMAPAYGLPPSAAPAYGLPTAGGGGGPAPALATAEDPPAGAGVVDQLMHHLRVGMRRYKKHYLSGVLTMGLIVIPCALVNALVGWIPVIGFIVALALGVAELLLVPLAAGAMGRWALSTAAHQELSWKQAWKSALKDPVKEWLNIVVAQLITVLGLILLIVPGLIVGMFALPAYLLENKTFFGINGRSAELVMKDAGGTLGLGLLTILALIPAALLIGIVTFVVAFIPFVGEPMSAFLAVVVNVFVGPFLYLLWAQVYYATVRRLEGNDPTSTYAATLQGWSAE